MSQKTEAFYEDVISDIKDRNQDYRTTRIFVPTIGKEIDFVLPLFDNDGTIEIDEYLWTNETIEEMNETELWVQEMGGADIIAKSVGLVDTQWNF